MVRNYRIGEFARLAGISIKTLRFYDEIGLLRPVSIDARTRYRHYAAAQLEEVASILSMKELGVPLGEIRSLVRKGGSAANRRELLGDLRKRIEYAIRRATQSLDCIDAAVRELDRPQPPVPVVVKRREAMPIASVRARVDRYADIERYERELLAALPAHAIGSTRGVLWHRCADSGVLEGEAFVALKRRVPARSGYDLKLLPGATLACAYAASDDQSSEEAYGALRRWVAARRFGLAGPKREIYLDQTLEIQFPLG